MNPAITLYAKTRGCQQCTITKRHLDKLGIDYETRYVDTDQAAADQIAILGYRSVPVVTAGDMHWAGYRPDKLDQLATITVVDTSEHEQAAEDYLTEDGAA